MPQDEKQDELEGDEMESEMEGASEATAGTWNLELIQKEGINAADIKKLRQGGISPVPSPPLPRPLLFLITQFPLHSRFLYKLFVPYASAHPLRGCPYSQSRFIFIFSPRFLNLL